MTEHEDQQADTSAAEDEEAPHPAQTGDDPGQGPDPAHLDEDPAYEPEDPALKRMKGG